MVERGRLPGSCGMALGAVRAKAPAMRIIFGMTAIARGWETAEYIVGMATRTRKRDVRAGQPETGQVVIECRREPAGGQMALRTIRAKGSVVMVVFCMATITGQRKPRENIIDVTVRTGDRGVSPRQHEIGCIVIECGRFPSVRGMATSAAGPQLSIVRVVLGMA
jgi:hypothetical protein